MKGLFVFNNKSLNLSKILCKSIYLNGFGLRIFSLDDEGERSM